MRTARKTKIYGILNPTTLKPKTLRLKCATDVFKNWPLGHGSFRVASNFGPLTPTIQDAKRNGFDDVLWTLDGFIKEMTVINVFAVIKSTINSALNSLWGIPPIGPTTPEKVT